MGAVVSPEQWSAVRAAYAASAQRFIDLAGRVPPQARATRDWSVADTVAHMVTLARFSAEAAALRHSRPELIDAVKVDTVADLNDTIMAQLPERDVAVLVTTLRSDLDLVLRATADADPCATVPWLGGSRLSTAALHAHMMNEFHIHGRDIALATRQPWTVPPEEAVLFFELFMIGIVRTGYGALLEDGRPARPGRIAVEFHSDYSQPVTMVLTDGIVTIEEPGADIDVKLHFDPPALNQMMFGRISKPRAAITGKVRVWGRRPWLLAPFLAKVHMPS